MPRVHCRCRHCDTRRVLPKHPDKYKVVPRCRVCGKRYFTPKRSKLKISKPIFRVDGWMNRRTAQNRALGCMCPCYDWEGNMTGAMHRRGSKKCWYRSDGTKREFGDKDYYMDPEWQPQQVESELTKAIDSMYTEVAAMYQVPEHMLRGEPREGFHAISDGEIERWHAMLKKEWG